MRRVSYHPSPVQEGRTTNGIRQVCEGDSGWQKAFVGNFRSTPDEIPSLENLFRHPSELGQDFLKICLVFICPLGVSLVVFTVSNWPSLERENSCLTRMAISLLPVAIC